jgi:sporulation protein YlmC with PRC-barrel domain
MGDGGYEMVHFFFKNVTNILNGISVGRISQNFLNLRKKAIVKSFMYDRARQYPIEITHNEK